MPTASQHASPESMRPPRTQGGSELVAPAPPLNTPPSPASPASSAVATFDSVENKPPAPIAALTPEQRASRLREEAAILREARDALRIGNLAAAFAALEVARSRFPSGALGQECEALTIELLARGGQRNAARSRAAAFLAAQPNSAFAARIREVLRE